MGRHGFPGIPRRFGMQLPLVAMVLREASALMRISSTSIHCEQATAHTHLYCNSIVAERLSARLMIAH